METGTLVLSRATAQTRDLVNYIDRLLDGWRALYQADSKPPREADRGYVRPPMDEQTFVPQVY